MKILIAEDNPDNMDMLTRRLQRRGFVTHGVGDGRQALAALEAFRPDVILMDVSMPVMSGLEATRIIRKESKGHSHTPIIMLSAHAMESDRARCFEAGCDAFATKPIDFKALLKLIVQTKKGAA